ncbi:hypothetical protein [Rhizobium sp. R634]|uniref:hypothetical protein n=1 Tax=Rhizobium sp. R634 TaxID=1764274 RepID=UPI00167D8DAE|nr:hypothetical protein [Rhizobium sp. R634]
MTLDTAYKSIPDLVDTVFAAEQLKSISIIKGLVTCPLRTANTSSIDCQDKEDTDETS